MRSLLPKLKLIYLPFLLIGILFVAAYTFLHWLLVIRLALVSMKEDLLQFWLPMALPWIPILLWLRRRINLLAFKGESDKKAFAYQMVAWGAFAVPAMIAQSYLVAATGKLTALDTISQLDRQPEQTKYYSLRKYYVDKEFAGIFRTASVSGKYNEHLDLYIYLTCPIWENPVGPVIQPVSTPASAPGSGTPHGGQTRDPLIVVDGVAFPDKRKLDQLVKPEDIHSISVLKGKSSTARYGERGKHGVILITTNKGNLKSDLAATASPAPLHPTTVWLGIKYHQQISNRLSDEEKEAAFQRFDRQSLEKFTAKNVQEFVYLDRIGNSDDREAYLKAVKENSLYKDSGPVTVLLPVNEPFAARTGNKLAWIFGSFGMGSGLFFLLLLAPKLDKRAYRQHGKGKPVRESDLKEVLSVLVPKPGFFVTPILMQLNLILFLLMVIAGLGFLSFKSADLLEWGANYKPLTTRGQWWRLLTSTFLHGGLMHLLMNLYGLMFAGMFLEPLLGKVKLLLIYLLTGMLASVSSLLWYQATVSVGASGAIFGLYGVFLALLLRGVFESDFKKSFLAGTAIFVGYNLLFGFLVSGIDNAAHIGGLVSGLVIGYLVNPSLQSAEENQGE